MPPKTPATKKGWQERYLVELERLGTLTGAAKAAGVNPKTAYEERQRNPEFAAAVESLCVSSVEKVEDTLYTMAASGENVAATIFFLKSRKPEVYADKLREDQVKQIRVQERERIMGELHREIAALAPRARRAIMAAIPSAA